MCKLKRNTCNQNALGVNVQCVGVVIYLKKYISILGDVYVNLKFQYSKFKTPPDSWRPMFISFLKFSFKSVQLHQQKIKWFVDARWDFLMYIQNIHIPWIFRDPCAQKGLYTRLSNWKRFVDLFVSRNYMYVQYRYLCKLFVCFWAVQFLAALLSRSLKPKCWLQKVYDVQN